MRKRQKFVLTSVLLAGFLALIQITTIEIRYMLIILLCLVTWVFSAWSLREGLEGVEWLTVLLPQTLFTAGVGFFFILLPGHWLARVVVIFLFALGQYASLLTANIFSVASIRTIALFRAAGAVGFIMSLLTGFLLFNSVLSFKMGFWLEVPSIFFISLAIIVPALWCVELPKSLTRKILVYSLFLAVGMALMALAISFWPVTVVVSSIFLTTMLYVYLGITQHHFSDKLFGKTAWEYVAVGAVVLVTMLISSVYV